MEHSYSRYRSPSKAIDFKVPIRPTPACYTIHVLPLRSEREQVILIGSERFGTNPSIIFHTYIMLYLSLLLCNE